jgi:hypothetical protein
MRNIVWLICAENSWSSEVGRSSLAMSATKSVIWMPLETTLHLHGFYYEERTLRMITER